VTVPAGDTVLPVILARGWTRRIPGDKALLPWKGRPLVVHALEAMRELPGEPLIVTKRPEGYGGFGCTTIVDTWHEETPISGILTAAAWAEERSIPWLMIAGADTIPTVEGLYRRLWELRPRETLRPGSGIAERPPAPGAPGSDAAAPPSRAVLIAVNGIVQPIPGLYHISAIPFWRAAFHRHAYRLTPIAEQIPAQRLAFDSLPYLNINTRDQVPRTRSIA
jgi:molybdopterin-guanine dinucleotide biosynthesis protein A